MGPGALERATGQRLRAWRPADGARCRQRPQAVACRACRLWWSYALHAPCGGALAAPSKHQRLRPGGCALEHPGGCTIWAHLPPWASYPSHKSQSPPAAAAPHPPARQSRAGGGTRAGTGAGRLWALIRGVPGSLPRLSFPSRPAPGAEQPTAAGGGVPRALRLARRLLLAGWGAHPPARVVEWEAQALHHLVWMVVGVARDIQLHAHAAAKGGQAGRQAGAGQRP